MYVNQSGAIEFSIDRGSVKCLTPRRNEHVNSLILFFLEVTAWFTGIEKKIMQMASRTPGFNAQHIHEAHPAMTNNR